jgi:DNA-binding Lrp family transcriptional regulator
MRPKAWQGVAKIMDATDRDIINTLQLGFPISERPYAEVAEQLGINETELLQRLKHLLHDKKLSRFGPMYQAEKLGGAFSLAAMQVPDESYDTVAELVNSYPEVAHNYQRDHAFNMWFVLATETPQRVDEVNEEISRRTGLPVFNMPKLKEYYVGLCLKAES